MRSPVGAEALGPPQRAVCGASQAANRRRLLLAPLAGLVLTGCAAWRGGRVSPAAPPSSQAEGWHEVPLPGKRPTRYANTRKDGRAAVHARADNSASMWRRKVNVSADQLGQARWSWRVDALNAQASISDVDREDAVARVIFAFDGDHSRLSARNRAMFDLARALTGETPPYATLMYVWETHQPVDTVVVNPRSDRIRKLVLDSGPEHLGTWRVHQRDLVADFERVFGEKPGALVAIGKMTDADNTQSRAEAWYGSIELVT